MESNQSIEILNYNYQLTTLYPDSEIIKKESYLIPVKTGFIAQITSDIATKKIDLKNYFRECFNKEIDSHPLSMIRSQNLTYLSELDNAWAKIHCVDQDNQIVITDLIKTGIYNFIWLQEIFIYFGWFNNVELFYQAINKYALNDNELLIIQSCLFRYNHICLLLGREEINSIHIQPKKKKKIEGKYLNYFLKNFHLKNSSIYENIQKVWNYLHLPAIQLKLKTQIYENPDEYIALACLALYNHFWWYPRLESLILKNLPIDKQAIFKFHSLVNKLNNLYFEKDSICFSKFHFPSNVEEHKNIMGQYLHKTTKYKREHYTYFEKANSFSIRINKNVEIQYSCKTNAIEIIPHLYYKIEKSHSKCKMQISENNLHVPLIWDQFVIEFNRCRLRFLRKKNRYQVTIKLAKTVKQITLNNEIINNNSGRIEKYYIRIKRNKSIVHLSSFNEYGARIQTLNPKMTRLFLKGYEYNVFGILNTEFRVYYNSQKKSYKLNLNKINEQPLLLENHTDELTLRAAKSDPCKIKYKHIDPIIYKLAYLNPAEMFYVLKIYIEDQNINISGLRKVCLRNLGFMPSIAPISELIPDKNKIIVIICETYNGEILKDNDEIRIIRINDKSKQTAIWLNPNYIKNLFSEAYFWDLFQ